MARDSAATPGESMRGYPKGVKNPDDLIILLSDFPDETKTLIDQLYANGILSLDETEDIAAQFLGENDFSLINPHISRADVAKTQLHSHSNASDGSETPAQVVTNYRNWGYDAVALTDHDMYTPDPGVSGIVFIGGTEVSHGNMPPDPDPYYYHENRFTGVTKTQYNHANFWASAYTRAKIQRTVWNGFVEIYNAEAPPNRFAEDVVDRLLSSGSSVITTAGDDSHSPGTSNLAWSMIAVDIIDLEHILAAMDAGNLYSTTGPDMSVTDDGTSITVTTTAAGTNTIEFFGKFGLLLQKTVASTASYIVLGGEMYVRARITNVNGAVTTYAWSQPISVLEA